ncbi:helix-turn-helix transcriptional regulator [Pseudomonas putida]|uniref:Helix-turn-helix domain-containing protein n=1 Tax=Pseudomonas vlassakiae TaxID=485888 RepID=A0A923K5K7_9PSED|nr:helix-turn-helix transcriptional regulator [Pseudomonas putida]MBV4542858.1 helix-turn-helix domain-containing protein [Pseudomonas vlassakiae]
MNFHPLGRTHARLRKEHGNTQTQLAERLCMFQQTIQTYESGNRRI